MNHDNMPSSKKERKLVKSVKLGVPTEEIDPYLEYLTTQRKVVQEELNKKEESFKEYETLYQEAKAEVESCRVRMEKYDRQFQNVLAFKENPSGEGMFFYAANTQEEPKKRSSKREYQWLPKAIEVLRKEDHFMGPQDILNTILRDNPSYRKVFSDLPNNGETFKTQIFNNWVRASNLVHTRKVGKQEIVMYENKFGLFEWVDSDLRPLPKYLKEFVMTSNTVKGNPNALVVL